jgi:hypothetical protein
MEWILILIVSIAVITAFSNWIKKKIEKENKLKEAGLLEFLDKIVQNKTLEPIPTNILLKNNEFAFLESFSRLSEPRNIRRYKSSGAGFRVTKRLYLRGSGGSSYTQEVFSQIDSGTLTLTNKRLIFNGSSNTRNIQIDKIISANASVTSLDIAAELRQKVMVFFNLANPLIWEHAIKIVNQVSDPFNLTDNDVDFITGWSGLNLEGLPGNGYNSTKEYVQEETEPGSSNTKSQNDIAKSNLSEESDNKENNPFLRVDQKKIQHVNTGDNYNYSLLYSSKINENYRARRNNLFNTFKSGYDFLRNAENNNMEIWLGTAKNAHLYLRNNYLAYIMINEDSLSFRPRYNNKIYSDTVDNSDVMFEAFEQLIRSYDGFNKRWAIRDREIYIFNRNTPKNFFDALLEYINRLNV